MGGLYSRLLKRSIMISPGNRSSLSVACAYPHPVAHNLVGLGAKYGYNMVVHVNISSDNDFYARMESNYVAAVMHLLQLHLAPTTATRSWPHEATRHSNLVR
jgi:hypothetical protein